MPKLQDVLTSATLILKEKLILIQESNLYDRENSLSVKVKFEVRELILELKYFNILNGFKSRPGGFFTLLVVHNF